MAASPSAAPAAAFPKMQRKSPTEVRAMDFEPVDAKTREQSAAIVEGVKAGGEAALLDFATKFGDLKPGQKALLDKADLEAAWARVGTEVQELLTRVAGRIREFAAAQRAALTDVDVPVPGGRAGHTVAAVEVAGCYAPGGRYPLPSSVMMTAVTARAAGVARVFVASPRPTDVTLAAAFASDADGLLAIGGAQAIAAMAFGIGGVPPCDVIVGPGNRWVTAAKAIVAGRCGIDMLAGPSECLVLADETADPAIVAADLLAQAEHDADALPILVTTSAELADAVDDAVAAQLATLQTRDVAAVAIAKGLSVVCPDMDSAVAVTNGLAPEHLEVQTADSVALASRLTAFGGIFIGPNTAEVFGDYGAGPNHVLPTGGTGKYTGGLSVFTFLRIRTWLRSDTPAAGADREAFEGLVRDTAALARLEGLRGHERAALRRSDNATALIAAAELEAAEAKDE
ncbi:hypothetical protein FNF29_00286 [Cafeteria roenbergensis]|nr:hypothetical protein FNF29_00286 [Cafeteria roenbergensis]KAA0161667.1 hypothetical protein FNF28_04971 [Cafeteria roenbergensis]|eukprot:KAA0157712.1 hypothetical protein FNF29_00286 [Cafeteria roenbergensis]